MNNEKIENNNCSCDECNCKHSCENKGSCKVEEQQEKKVGCCSTVKIGKEDLDEESERHHHHHKVTFINKITNFMGWTTSHHHHHDHGDHDHEHSFEPKIWIMVLATVLGFLALYHMIIGLFVSGSIIEFLDNDYTQLVFGTIAFVIMGIAFIKGSILTIIKKEIAEDTLVAIATGSAYIYSLSVFIMNVTTGSQLPYFFYEQIEILWLIYFGRFLEDWLSHRVMREMESLSDLKPKLATVIRDGEEIEIKAKDIVIGDIALVKAGQLIPTDGVVIEGETTIDESSLTGESIPVNKYLGSNVFGGTISGNGLIRVEVTKLLDDSFISQIINSVNESIKTKPQSQRVADKIAKWLIPSVLILATISFFVTGIVFSVGGASLPTTFINMANSSSAWLYAYYILITVLVIACPCSFAMTTPMSVLVASSTSKKEGVIFSSNKLFEDIKKVDTICFDKTGTLTKGEFEVIDYKLPKEYLEELVSIESHSNHPLAKSIVKNFNDVKVNNSIKVKEVIGKGMESNNLKVGSLKWLNELLPNYKEDEDITSKRKLGSAIIYVFNNSEVLGYIELLDNIKDDSLMAISQIRKMGIDVIMITGDHKDTSLHIAGKLGIKEENVYYEVNPNDKSDIISELKNKGKVVAFVGDGINDSIALTNADIGIAMGEGSDVAIEAADIVLNNSDIALVAYSIWLSRKTLSTIKRGFAIAIIYNAIMVPAAATGVLGLTGAGPAIAAMSMVFNDSIAMVNAMTLSADTKRKFERSKNKSKS